MQIPPTMLQLFLDPPPATPPVYDTPPLVVRRRRLRGLASGLRRSSVEPCRPTLSSDVPSHAVCRG